MVETIRNAMPNDVGGILRRMVGANDVAERMKSVKFKEHRRRMVKEHVFLVLEEAILVFSRIWFLKKFVEKLSLIIEVKRYR
jgi:hypothetical protein